MIQNLTIQNFRLFKEFTVDGLVPVNLIVGKNNVAKSSLLEAIYLLTTKTSSSLAQILDTRGETAFIETENGHTEDFYNISYLFEGHTPSPEDFIEISSQALSLKILITRANEKEVHRKAQLRPTSWLKIIQQEETFSIELFDNLMEKRWMMPRWATSASPLSQGNVTFITTSSLDYASLAKLWDKITLTPKEENIIQMLQVLDPTVERISFQSRQSSRSGILIKRRGEKSPVPLGSMGDGMQRLLGVVMSLANSENGYLLIDEIDTGLHYSVITNMWKLILAATKTLNVQVFATTHSLDCERSFAEALSHLPERNQGSLFRMQKRGGKIVAIKYTAEELKFALDQDVEVR